MSERRPEQDDFDWDAYERRLDRQAAPAEPTTASGRWEEWARRIAPLVHDGLIDTPQERQIIDKAFYIARLLDEHLPEAEARQPSPGLREALKPYVDGLHYLAQAEQREAFAEALYAAVDNAARALAADPAAQPEPLPPLSREALAQSSDLALALMKHSIVTEEQRRYAARLAAYASRPAEEQG